MTEKARVKKSTIENSIRKIKATVRSSPSISSEKRVELLYLISILESEIGELYESKPAHAQYLVGSIERSTAEAMRQNKNKEQLSISLENVAASVKEFEVSHPRLVADVNSICTILANMGI